MRTPFVAGNWKMNVTAEESDFPEEAYIHAIRESAGEHVEICIFPPFTHIGLLSAIADGDVNIGAQDVSDKINGAHTGDVSARCLIDIGASYVLVGHSERRVNHGETDSNVCKKARTALNEGLNVVVCVGESDEQNQAGKTIEVLTAQLNDSIPENVTADRVVVAYEPVWAIGTGRVPTLEQIETVHKELRKHLMNNHGSDFANDVRIVYGGSVKPDNANAILNLDNVDGALVGGASLKSEDLVGIIKGAS